MPKITDIFELIEKGIDAGLTANQMLAHLKELGLGYRRQDFLADYRRIAGKRKRPDSEKYVPIKYRKSKIIKTPRWQSTKYYSYVEARLVVPDTGVVSKQIIIVAHDKRMNEEEILENAERILMDNQGKYNFQELLSLRYMYTKERID